MDALPVIQLVPIITVAALIDRPADIAVLNSAATREKGRWAARKQIGRWQAGCGKRGIRLTAGFNRF